MNKKTVEEIIDEITELSETYGDKAIYEALDTLERERRFLDRIEDLKTDIRSILEMGVKCLKG
jgi:Fe2+ or Zn2+ uptake regulation protein